MNSQIKIVFIWNVLYVETGFFMMLKIEFVLKELLIFVRNMKLLKIYVLNVNLNFIWLIINVNLKNN